METRYRVDENRIVHEVLDQEAMLVNLDNGYYYALEGSAVQIWQAVLAGDSVTGAAGDAQVRDHCVAGALVRVHYATPALAASLSQAMSLQLAMPPASNEPPSLSIYAWGGEMPGGLLPPPSWDELDTFERGNV